MKFLDPRFKLLCCLLSLVVGGGGSLVNAQMPDVQAPKRAEPTAFWNSFASSVLGRLQIENNKLERTAILTEAREMVQTNLTDPFVCKALYSIGLAYYKQGDFLQAKEFCQMALKHPQTQPGNYLSAWNLIAECCVSLGDYDDAIKASDEELKCDGPGIMKSDLDQIALTRKADLLLRKPNPTKEQRNEAEAILTPLTEIDNKGPFSELQGQLARARIGNLVESGEIRKAHDVGEYFVRNHPTDPWSGVICADLCKLTNHYANVEQLEPWNRFFDTNHVPMSAGVANLKMDLMNAYARTKKYEQAIRIADEIVNFIKNDSDPVPWDQTSRDIVSNTKRICLGSIQQLQGRGAEPPNEVHRAPVLAVLGVVTIVPLVAMVVFRRKLSSGM